MAELAIPITTSQRHEILILESAIYCGMVQPQPRLKIRRWRAGSVGLTPTVLFKENKGTCTTKHAIIAGLAKELDIPLQKNVGVYRFTEEITTGAQEILNKYNIPYVPMVHCFLVYNDYRFDLTEGNDNGKKTSIKEFIQTREVEPFITRKDEYIWYKKVLKENVLTSSEMKGIKEKSLLKAREESILLLKNTIKR